jgi:hypothetical protein
MYQYKEENISSFKDYLNVFRMKNVYTFYLSLQTSF